LIVDVAEDARVPLVRGRLVNGPQAVLAGAIVVPRHKVERVGVHDVVAGNVRHADRSAKDALGRPEDAQRPGDARLVADGRFGRTVRRRVAARVDGVGLRHEVHVLVDDRQIQHEDHAREARWNQRDATRVGSEAHVDERETQVVVDELEAVGLHAHDLITALTYNHQRIHTPTHRIQSS